MTISAIVFVLLFYIIVASHFEETGTPVGEDNEGVKAEVTSPVTSTATTEGLPRIGQYDLAHRLNFLGVPSIYSRDPISRSRVVISVLSFRPR